jgi:hypothetical protein
VLERYEGKLRTGRPSPSHADVAGHKESEPPRKTAAAPD